MYGYCNVCMFDFCNIWVCIYVGFVMCGCYGNMFTCIYSVFVLFHLYILFLFMFLFNFFFRLF